MGDAVICTNPLYGRGCSTGYWGAHLMSEALAGRETRSGRELFDVAVEYDAAINREIKPWYESGVQQDAEARRVAAALLRGDDPDGDSSDPKTMMRSVLREGLLPALRTDPVVLRAFMRNLNLLSSPDALMKDTEVMNRVFMVWQDRENRPSEVPMGPKKRAQFLELLPA